jgi:hypothetical protein
LGTGGNSRITKVTDITGTPVASEFLSQATWSAASGVTSIASFYGFGDVGDAIQFSDTSSDQVWQVDKGTGAISAYATQADIMAATGGTAVQLLTPTEVWGTERVFYEGSTDQICLTNGWNSVTVLVTTAQLQAAQGNTAVSGGIGPEWGTTPGNGDIYWGNTTSDDMWMFDGVAVSQVLSTADIVAVTGRTTAGFRDIFPAPDGWVYFYESTKDSILRFDPSDPAGTLEFVLREAYLNAGPAGSDGVYELDWYYDDPTGHLAFNIFSTHGLYVIPEPASVALLALAGLTLLRRRR